jgi:hypothetical protein
MTVSKLQRLLTGLITTSLLVVTLLPLTAHAAQITGRKLTLSTSSPSAGATVTYTFNFTVPTTGTVVQSWAAQICDATATQIQLSGTMDETLVFCTGGTITGTNCGTATSGSVAFGTNFSSTATSTATSHMVAATNAAGGYVVAVSGSTLTCSGCSGTPNIAALTAGGASSTGSAQFGLNVVSNATPSVGAAVSPSSNGSNLRGQGLNGYGTADSFKFNSGDTIANSGNASLGPTDAQNYTVSYIANVPASQAAGAYTSTLTYICTATF